MMIAGRQAQRSGRCSTSSAPSSAQPAFTLTVAPLQARSSAMEAARLCGAQPAAAGPGMERGSACRQHLPAC